MDLSKLEERLTAVELHLAELTENFRKLTAAQGNNSKTESLEHPDPLITVIPGPNINKYSGKEQANWLGIVAVICFVLAAGFIIKLSIDTGWLTHQKQVAITTLFGLGLIFSRTIFTRLDPEYATFLPSAGIIILYLTTFAAHLYYSLITFEMAICLVSIISAFCLWLYSQTKHDLYVITAVVGAYISPMKMNFYSEPEFTLYYFLICSMAFTFISIWVRSRKLILISAYLAILMSGLVGASFDKNILVASMLMLHFFIFSFGTYFYSRVNNISLSDYEAMIFLPVLLIFYVIEYNFINLVHPGLAPWISLGTAAITIILYLSAKKYLPDSSGSEYLVIAFTTIVCFHSLYLNLLPAIICPWLFVVIVFGMAFVSLDYFSQKQINKFYFPILGVLLVLFIEYISMLCSLFFEIGTHVDLLIVSFAACTALWTALLNKSNKINKHNYLLLTATHILAISGFWHLTNNSGTLIVSISWLFYAVCVMLFAYSYKDIVIAKSALFILTLASAKALLYDLDSEATIVRILCLLLIGTVVYGCGLVLRKLTNKQFSL